MLKPIVFTSNVKGSNTVFGLYRNRFSSVRDSSSSLSLQMSEEENVEKNVVLTPPISLDGGMIGDLSTNFQRALSLVKNVRPGSDLTRFQLPTQFNLPKSLLQLMGESVYCVSEDLLSRCANGMSPLDRLMAVVAWSISTIRPPLSGVGPFNPILGETHHVSRGSLNVLLEQVSHHPPVTALHAMDEKEKLELVWCQHPDPKFHGTTVEATFHGKRQLKLLNHGEIYVMNSPSLLIRIFPKHSTHWVGGVTIRCEESGLGAELCYRSNSGKERSVKGKIFAFSSTKSSTLFEIKGHWDRTVTAKDVNNGTETVIYNAKEAISRLKIPEVNNPKEIWPNESVLVWSEVSQSILKKDWEKANEAKATVENKQRELSRERESRSGEAWIPQNFNVSYTKEGGWECSAKLKCVPPAPIVVPL